MNISWKFFLTHCLHHIMVTVIDTLTICKPVATYFHNFYYQRVLNPVIMVTTKFYQYNQIFPAFFSPHFTNYNLISLQQQISGITSLNII